MMSFDPRQWNGRVATLCEPAPVSGADLRDIAVDVLAEGSADPFARSEGVVLDPLGWVAPDGASMGWALPVAFTDPLLGEVLLGMVHVGCDRTFEHYTSFQRRPGAIETCPPVAAWTDTDVVAARAMAVVHLATAHSNPVLTFEGTPDRLVWAVDVETANADCLRVHVAGKSAWLAPLSR